MTLLKELLKESKSNGFIRVEQLRKSDDKNGPLYKAFIYDEPKGQITDTYEGNDLKNLFDEIIDMYGYSRLQLLDDEANLVNTKGDSAYKAAKGRIEDNNRKI